jgi:iron complex outermembrane receptor protein
MRSANVSGIVDLARNVTSLTIADLGPGQSQMAIRGISSGQVIRDQPGVKEQVGVYLDESPISVALFTPDLELFDLQRFEVLRGPQGTLFGAGSTAGTLRYITQEPKLGKYEGAAEASLSSVTDGGTGGAVRGAVNIPMGETAAARLVGYYNRIPGFIDAIQPGGAIKKDVNQGDRSGGRVALLFKPNEQLSITPRIVYQKLTTDGYPRMDAFNILANPFTTTEPKVTIGDLQQYTQQREGIDDDFKLGDLKVDYDFGPVTLTSVSSYTDRKVTVLRDATQLTGSVTFDVGGTPAEVRITSPLYDRTKLKVFSQELRLASNGSDTLQWVAGAFYQDVDRKYGQSLPTPGYDAITRRLFNVVSSQLNAPPDTPFYSDLSYKLKQYAVFGEATFHANDQWAFTEGVRWYKFDEKRVLNFGGFFADPTPPGGVPGSTTSNGVSPRLIVSYKASADMQFTAQLARGFRLGGINDPINKPLCSPDDLVTFGGADRWQDETAWNSELGAKMRFADRRVTFNVAAFYDEIKNLQATVTAGTCSSRIIYNVPKAHSEGLEAELFARPNANWDFGVSATWVQHELDSSVVSVSPAGAVTVIGGLAKGAQLPTSPEFQAVASVGYTMPFGADRSLFANLTWQHNGSSFSQFENNTANFGAIGGPPGSARIIRFGAPTFTSLTFDSELDSYNIGNLRVGVRNQRWEVAGFVSNLTDERAHLALDYERGRSARVGYLVNPPRTYGVTARWNF